MFRIKNRSKYHLNIIVIVILNHSILINKVSSLWNNITNSTWKMITTFKVTFGKQYTTFKGKILLYQKLPWGTYEHLLLYEYLGVATTTTHQFQLLKVFRICLSNVSSHSFTQIT